MTNLELPAPLKGLDRNGRLSEQPPLTSRDLLNVWPIDRTTGRMRMGPRPGLSPYFTGALSGSGNKVQALVSVPYAARHVTFSADSIPNEQFATVLTSGATISSICAGLNDDIFAIVDGTRLVHYSRYGIELGSANIQGSDTAAFTNGALHCDRSTGAIYVATQFAVGAPTGARFIWKYALDVDNETPVLQWALTAGICWAVASMRVVGDSLWTFETNSTTGNAELVEYANINTAGGPDSVVGSRILHKTISDSNIAALDALWVGSGQVYAHDMDMRTSGETSWVVAVGTVNPAGAGVWAQLKIKPNFTITANYCFVNNEASAVTTARGGGVGFACRVGLTGNVFSIGRRNPNDTGSGVWMRMMVDTGTAWSTSLGWTRTNATDLAAAANQPGWAYPVVALDQYGNFFAPTCFSSTSVAAVKCVKTDGTLFTSVVHYEDTTTPGTNTVTSNDTRAVALPSTGPIFQDDDYKIADTVFCAGTAVNTLQTDLATTGSMQGYDILLETPADVSSRNTAHLGVSGGNIVRFTTAGTTTPTNSTGRSPPLSASSRLVQWADAFGEVFFTDGQDYAIYRPSPPLSVITYPQGRIVNWAPNSLGIIPPRCRLICRWRGRMVLAHSADSPFAWHMSKFSDPYTWDTDPPERIETQAVSYLSVPNIGAMPRPIHALIPWSDDLLFFGCSGMIQRLSGDPMSGGQLHQVTKDTGMAFGTPWCMDPEGRMYFFGDKGGVYSMSAIGELQWLTRDTIEEDLADIDLSVNRVELHWNSRDNGLHVWVLPHAAGGTHLRHYFWSQRTQGWFPVEIGTDLLTTMQPTACCTIDGDTPGERVMLLGTEGGEVLKWNPDVSGDNGQPISAKMLIGPIAGSEEDLEARFSRPSLMLASELGGCHFSFFSSDTPDTPTIPRSTIRVGPGVNARMPIRTRGAYCWASLSSSSRVAAGVPALSEKWSLESLHVEANAAGRKRVRA